MLWAPPGFSHPSSLFNHPTARPLKEAWGRGSRSPGLRDQPVPPSVIDGDLRPGREGLTQDHPKRGRRSWDLGQLPDSKCKLPTSHPHPPSTPHPHPTPTPVHPKESAHCAGLPPITLISPLQRHSLLPTLGSKFICRGLGMGARPGWAQKFPPLAPQASLLGC